MARGFERPPGWALVTMTVAVVVTAVLAVLLASRQYGDPITQAEIERMSEARAAAEAAEPPIAVFLGDSYTAASDNGSDGEYANATAAELGWEPVTLGQGGTGYINPGQPEEGEAVYLERVPQVVAAEPDVVVVQGGGNDALIDPECDIQDDATEVFTALREQLPDAQIVALLSVPGPGADRVAFSRCAGALNAAAAALDVPVIDPAARGWLTDPALFVDGFHLTAEGYAQFSALLAGQLRVVTG